VPEVLRYIFLVASSKIDSHRMESIFPIHDLGRKGNSRLVIVKCDTRHAVVTALSAKTSGVYSEVRWWKNIQVGTSFAIVIAARMRSHHQKIPYVSPSLPCLMEMVTGL
jgi:hypothetical protein